MNVYVRLTILAITAILYVSTGDRREIKKIIIHTTDTGKLCGAKCVDKIHVARGWESCGYHYIVMHDGKVEKCRDEGKVGAHTKGYNEDSLGVAWAGHEGDLTEDQYASLLLLVKILIINHNLSKDDVYGHNQFPTAGKKTCPSIDMNKFRKELN